MRWLSRSPVRWHSPKQRAKPGPFCLSLSFACGRFVRGPPMRAHKLAPIFLAAPTSPDARLKAIAAVSRGFVYAISRVGITGTQQNVAGDAAELVARLRQFTTLPIAVGFGISNAEHVKAVGEFADAAVIGSALVGLIEKTPPPDAADAAGRFVAGLRV